MSLDPHVKAYADFLASKARMKMPMKIVCDFSNGPVSIVMKELASRLSLTLHVTMKNDDVHPDFPAHGPDPSTSEALVEAKKSVLEAKADLGVVFDGDGDRAVFIDERGEPISPAVIALYLMKNTPGTHVVDVLLYEAITHLDPSFSERVVPSKVGRYFISREMKARGAVLGAEFSGHFFFKDFFGFDSALLTLIALLNALSETGHSVSNTLSPYAGHIVIAGKAPIGRPFNEAVAGIKEKAMKRNPRVSDLDGLTMDFGDSWVNMRASNTEPVVRITAGAGDTARALALAEEFRASFL